MDSILLSSVQESYWLNEDILIMNKNMITFLILICLSIIPFSAKAYSDNSASLYPTQSYVNLIKSFRIRAGVDTKDFNYQKVQKFESLSIALLTHIYTFSEIRSHKTLPESVLQNYADPSEDGVLKEIEVTLLKMRGEIGISDINYYPEAKGYVLKMTYVITKTLVEFAPYLNIKNNDLRIILTSGLTDVVNQFHENFKVFTRAHSPYFTATEKGIVDLSHALKNQNIFQKIVTKFQRDKSPEEESHFEMGLTCSRIFE